MITYLKMTILGAAIWVIANHPMVLPIYIFWYIILVFVWAYFDGLYRRTKAPEVAEIIEDQIVSFNGAPVSRMIWEAGALYEDKDFKITKAQRFLVEFKKS